MNYSNNAYSVLESGITGLSTTIILAAGTGSRFPSSNFPATLIGYDVEGNETSWEIVLCSSRTSDTLTVTRGQEGTPAVAWAGGSRIENRLTAAGLAGLEPSIAAGTTSQYLRGDKSWRDFFTDVRAATLTGLSTATNAVITAADTVLSALGKLQKQVIDVDSAKLDKAGGTMTGNLNFSGIGQRITGDFSNATVANRLAFQTNITNSATLLHIIPSGTATQCGLKLESDPAVSNGQVGAIDMIGGTEFRVSSNIRGAGAYVPTTFHTGGAERLRIGVDGVVDINGNLSVPSMNGGQLAGLRNKIINGGFDIWQRGASRSVGTGASTAYVSDRWMGVRSGFSTGGTVSQQPAGLTGFRYCARVQRDSGNADTAGINLEQDLETSACIPFQGAAVTLSFYARCGANYSAASSALAVRLVSGTGTDQNALVGTFTGATNAVDSTATLTTTWQRFSYTVTIGAGVTQLGSRFVHNPTGTAGAADYFEITGVQLEISSVATPFEHRPYGMELALCQRYYYRNTSSGTDAFGVAQASSSTQAYVVSHFPVTLRAAPTSLEQTGIAADYTLSGSVCSAVPALSDASNEHVGITVFTLSGGLTVNTCSLALASSSGKYLGWSAEL